MYNFGRLFNLLNASDAMIEQSAARFPGYEAPQPFLVDIRTLRMRQAALRERLEQEYRDSLRVQNPGRQTGLGVAPLIIGAGAAAVIGISAIGGWIYSHFTDAKALDAQTGVYQDLREDGTDAESAAQIVFGGKTDWGGIMNKAILLSLIGAGIFLVVKFVK